MKRQHVLENLVRDRGWTVGVELGVWYGAVLFHLLDSFTDLRMTGVDLWVAHSRMSDDEVAAVRKQTLSRAEKYGGRCRMLEADSALAAYEFDDATVDFVFVDADHSEEAVTRDIVAWQSRVRAGGAMLGHDSDLPGVWKSLNNLLPGWRQLPAKVWEYSV